MANLTFLAPGTLADMVALAADMGWPSAPLPSSNTWQPDAMDARATWDQIEPGLARLRIRGQDAEVLASDLSQVFDLIYGFDAIEALGQAASRDELVLWATRLGALAAGEFDSALFDVIRGLLLSEDEEFVAAVGHGLSKADWPQLVPPLNDAAKRWPSQSPAIEQALRAVSRPGGLSD